MTGMADAHRAPGRGFYERFRVPPQALPALDGVLGPGSRQTKLRLHQRGWKSEFRLDALAFMLAAHDDDRARRVMHAVLADRAKRRASASPP